MSIYAKLQDIQEKLKAPKNQFNKFGNYNYRNCEDILEGVKPLLKENGCVLIIRDEIQVIGDRYYIRAIVTLIDTESGKETFSTALAREEESKKGMDGAQVTGAASSYARKYALNGLFAIDDTKDADSKSPADNVTETISIEQRKKLTEGKDIEKLKIVCSKYGYESSSAIKKVDYEKILKELEAA